MSVADIVHAEDDGGEEHQVVGLVTIDEVENGSTNLLIAMNYVINSPPDLAFHIRATFEGKQRNAASQQQAQSSTAH